MPFDKEIRAIEKKMEKKKKKMMRRMIQATHTSPM